MKKRQVVQKSVDLKKGKMIRFKELRWMIFVFTCSFLLVMYSIYVLVQSIMSDGTEMFEITNYVVEAFGFYCMFFLIVGFIIVIYLCREKAHCELCDKISHVYYEKTDLLVKVEKINSIMQDYQPKQTNRSAYGD